MNLQDARCNNKGQFISKNTNSVYLLHCLRSVPFIASMPMCSYVPKCYNSSISPETTCNSPGDLLFEEPQSNIISWRCRLVGWRYKLLIYTEPIDIARCKAMRSPVSVNCCATRTYSVLRSETGVVAPRSVGVSPHTCRSFGLLDPMSAGAIGLPFWPPTRAAPTDLWLPNLQTSDIHSHTHCRIPVAS